MTRKPKRRVAEAGLPLLGLPELVPLVDVVVAGEEDVAVEDMATTWEQRVPLRGGRDDQAPLKP